MPNHYNFREDHKIAEKTERQMGKFLAETVPGVTFKGICNDNRWDLELDYNGRFTTVEVKEDFTCERTGNVGIEYESWGRKAGISVSKADFYLLKVHCPDGKARAYLIDSKKLKKICFETPLWFREVVGGDVGSESKNYLFKLGVIQQVAISLGVVPK